MNELRRQAQALRPGDFSAVKDILVDIAEAVEILSNQNRAGSTPPSTGQSGTAETTDDGGNP